MHISSAERPDQLLQVSELVAGYGASPIVHGIDVDRILFDAPLKHQQVWFVRRLGPDVNLGNITPEDVLSLETIRVGLRSDTAVAELDD